jgi:hypothetical protein
MLAVVRSILVDVGVIAGTFTAVMTAIAVFWKTPPVRWIRRAVSRSFGEWTQHQVLEANKEHHALVKYHLGPNGDTTPVHVRLQKVEAALKMPQIDWNAPYDDIEKRGQ